MEYDANFGALVRRKTKYPIDGIPLAVGLSCILKQFHPSYTKMVLAYLGQYIRSNLQDAFFEVDNKVADVPKDILHTMLFMDQLCQYSSIPRSMIYKYVPPYIFDSLKLGVSSSKK